MKATKIEVTEPTNGAKSTVEMSIPYTARVKLRGVADLLFHAWNPEAVDEKAAAAKGSKAKKSDAVETYLYRTEEGDLGLPGENLRQSIITAAKFKQDPRSPRKSAMDLFKAGIISETLIASLGVKEADYLDRRRVVVQRSGINRTRPAMRAGWEAEFFITVTLPEYISETLLHAVLADAGRLVGLCDFRPSFGRFQVVGFEVRAINGEAHSAAD